MRRKLRVTVAVVAVAALAFGIFSATSASAISSAQRFTLVAPDTEQQRFDRGPRGQSLGDEIVFSGPLRTRGGRAAGRLDGHCLTTSVRGGAGEFRQQCFITSTIGTANGETEIQAAGVGRIGAEDVVFSVTGGSGRFQNVRGQAVFDFTRADRVVITYQLIP